MNGAPEGTDMDNGYSPTILQGQQTNDDEILAKTPPLDPKALGGDSSVIIMELLQRFKVRDVMKRKIIAVSRDTSLREAQRLMRENRISGLPVCEEGRLYGIVSVNDIINALDNGWIEDTCEKHMACNLVVLEAGMPISFALRYFNNYTYGRFPVLDSNRKLLTSSLKEMRMPFTGSLRTRPISDHPTISRKRPQRFKSKDWNLIMPAFYGTLICDARIISGNTTSLMGKTSGIRKRTRNNGNIC